MKLRLPQLFQKKQHQPLNEIELFDDKFLNDLTDDQRKELAQVLATMQQTPEIAQGDGNAVFLEPMSEHQYAKWIHEEERGWRGIYNKWLNRNGN